MGAVHATTVFPARGPAGSPSPAAEQTCNEMGFSQKPRVWEGRQGLGAEMEHREELFTFLFFLLCTEV